jgi:CDP-diacylglycerol---serine O-phosphatidyltransferase
MRKLTKHIPNFLTLCNLLSGSLGIIEVMNGEITRAACLVWLGALFDFLDGFAARLTGSYSELGKELDSLADMVTFGLLPGYLMFSILSASTSSGLHLLPFIALLIPVFSALRLAKFNIDSRQKEDFIGLPTPANAFLLSGIPFLQEGGVFDFISSQAALTGIILIGSLLMVSSVRFPSLKFKNLNWNNNFIRYIIVIIAILLIIIFKLEGITPALIAYIIISLAWHLFTKNKINEII